MLHSEAEIKLNAKSFKFNPNLLFFPLELYFLEKYRKA